MLRQNTVVTKSFEFAVQIVQFTHELFQKNEYVISRQLLRSGTSVGANVRESQNAQSKADFIHKLYIAQKECDETLYWLEILQAVDHFDSPLIGLLQLQGTELLKIIRSIILSTKQNHFKQ